MKRINGNGVFGLVGITAIVVLASVLLVAAGCATKTGSDRSAAASLTMAKVEEDISVLVLELTTTNSALASLVNPLQDDLTTSYGVFSDSIGALEDASDDFIEQAIKMGAEGKEYFEEWQIQGSKYKNPQIQALSAQRQAELGESYTEISALSVAIQGELVDYVTKVKEIKTYFSTDLTVGGVSAMNPFTDQAVLDGFSLSVKLRDMLDSVSKIRAELSPGETVAVD